MSGLKHAQPRPNPVREMLRELNPLLVQLESLKGELEAAETDSSLSELEALNRALSQAQTDYDDFKVAGEERDLLYRSLKECEPLMVAGERAAGKVVDPLQVERQIDYIKTVLSSKDTGSFRSCHAASRDAVASCQRSLSALSEVSRCRGQLQRILVARGYYSERGGPQSPSRAAELRPDEIAARDRALKAERDRQAAEARARALREVADGLIAQLRREGELVDAMSAEERTLAEHDEANYKSLWAEVNGTLSGDEMSEELLERARGQIGELEDLRLALTERARVRLQQVRDRDLLAAHLEAKLSELNYDEADVYLDDEGLGERSELILFAESPLDRGDVRVAINLDLEMSFEVMGVAKGEEQICLSLLEGFREAAAASGSEIQITDYGRAAHLLTSAPRARVKQQQKTKMRGGTK